MANENLKRGNSDTQFRSGREAVENGRKGGIASGVSRNLKGAMKRYFKEHPEELDNIVRSAVKGFQETLDARLLNAIIDLNGESVQRDLAKVKKQELKLKERAMSQEPEDIGDDGFIEALNGTAAEDWGDDNE